MDRIYRHQRHIYDASRKFYLLGRDQLIDGLQPPPGATVLEIGCGTGRNLIRIARRYPSCVCYGLDVSSEMLATARASVAKAGLEDRIRLAQADATDFYPQALFGLQGFDRIVISYALSMIPPWQGVVAEALRRLNLGGSLHIVDFGDQSGLPAAFKVVLLRWLALFHVMPRENLPGTVKALAEAAGAECRLGAPYRGYAVHAVVRRRGEERAQGTPLL
ncbi:class I SAM-dependent methyltransferase [Bosea sp. F3-2]|uniref:class I SAM-dependent methyltransferase n=1 Tax=Bosea sp. F3-2 TaxID=2599640 RepID=UPI0011ECBCF9|nr:class I SAM-dependent methyltransferase [Bosea sp. F3-2]QEL26828.1 class I SAM-dependent methyltransferase [Bosea sp. F3-2]